MSQPQSAIQDIYPLTPMQHGMLYHTLNSPAEDGAYIQQIVVTLRGEIDPNRFQSAWQQIADRHSALRALFLWEDRKEPVQAICRRVSIPWSNEDWSGITDVGSSLNDYLAKDRARAFDPKRAPLMRFLLVRWQKEWRFVWSFHHVLLDGWCLSRLFREALEFYSAELEGRQISLPPARPFREYVAWLHRQDEERALSFWKGNLGDFTAPLQLAIETEPPQPGYGEVEIELPAATTQGLENMARQARVTVGALIQAMWAVMLSRYCRTSDVVFGLTQAGRPSDLSGSEEMIGIFINTVPVRVRVESNAALRHIAQAIFAGQAERDENGYAPLVKIVYLSSGIPGGSSLFETLVVFENYPVDRSLLPAGLEWLGARGYDRTGYPITLLVMPSETLTLRIVYDRSRFSDRTAGRILGHCRQLLEESLLSAHQPTARIALLSDEEKRDQRAWNSTARNYGAGLTLTQLLNEQAQRTPAAEAVWFEGESLTYQELHRRAAAVARDLVRHGAGPDRLVGVHLDRSLELVIALLAIEKAGAAYLALDPDYPLERVRFMIQDARPVLTIVRGKHETSVFPNSVAIGTLGDVQDSPLPQVQSDHLAYVLYTSGSTGVPKAVMNTHGGICNRLLWMQEAFSLGPGDTVIQKTPFSFDVSVWEFFWPLITGARLVVAAPGGHRDAEYLAAIIREQRVTTAHFVPSMLRVFLDEPVANSCTSLRRVISSGEALSPDTVDRFFRVFDCELHNLYGPTEAAVDVTWHRCAPGQAGQPRVPIGRPIANTQTYILDEALQPVAMGVPGELFLAGVQLARGYFGRAALTAERFLPNPNSDEAGSRMYRTGDLARWLPDGSIEYLGRIDHQVKIRGFRVELGEIESRLQSHPEIAQAAVTIHETVTGPRIAAWFVARPGRQHASHELVDEVADELTGELRRFLRETLPDYMVPDFFQSLDQLPLTTSGKVNRNGLPDPSMERPRAREIVEPCDVLEVQIATIWKDILDLQQVGVHDNFFDMGGNSLLMTSVLHRLRKQFEAELNIQTLFRYPTIASLAAYLRPPAPAAEKVIPERVSGTGSLESQRMARKGARA